MPPRPDKPIETYPVVPESERPPLPPADVPSPTGSGASVDKAPLPFERLAFRPAAKALTETVPLDFPFEWQGKPVPAVEVRRLAAFEVVEVAESEAFETAGMWAIYAAQSGLPIGVLRGLVEDDCDRVVEANRRFLPRAFREMLSRSDAEATPLSATPETAAPTLPA